jgi:hypothetical protein
MEILKPLQNPERYSHKGTDWIVSSLPDSPTQKELNEIKPITITKGSILASLKGVLSVDGIVVKVGSDYLCSQTTLDLIRESDNPHWDIIQNGVIKIKNKDVVIGKTIPIITLNSDKLMGIGDSQDVIAKNAGVNRIDYIYEGDMVDGISKGLIQQIDYTLLESVTRPGDSFTHYDWDKMVDRDSVYNIQPLNVQTAQADGKLDKVKLNQFLSDIKVRLLSIHKDTESIKQSYYNGILPTSLPIREYMNKVASTESSNDNGTYVVTSKSSTTISTTDTPTDKVLQSVSKSVGDLREQTLTNQKDLGTQLQRQQMELERAQQGDAQAQSQLYQQLREQNQRTEQIYHQLNP